MDIHRRQLTFEFKDSATGELTRGQVAPADRGRLREWLIRFEGVDDVVFAVEAGTGWRYVVEEMLRAGIRVELAEPADTSALRGPRRKAKTDKADAKLLRELLEADRIPRVWIPPSHVLECRALLETYQDLRREHTAWIQRIHAIMFHHGVPAITLGDLSSDMSRSEILELKKELHLTPTARVQANVADDILLKIENHLHDLRRELLRRGRQMIGARLLEQTIYGVGPITALALCCWLGGPQGRFSSSRQVVRFAGLDITVHSSDRKRAPGHLSRQGPPVLRWCLYEAAKTHSRTTAPDHDYYTSVKERKNGKRAALSEARRIARYAFHLLDGLGEEALALVEHTTPARAAARPRQRTSQQAA